MKVVAGLGNPGRTYERTRHNVGFDVVALLAEGARIEDRGGSRDLDWVQVRLPVWSPRPVPLKPGPEAPEDALVAWKAERQSARERTEEQSVLLARPLAFMNRSGPPLRALLEERGAKPESDLLVVVDDVDLEVGRLRMRASGSSGGHRGLESIELALGTQAYGRLRVGVGRNPPGVASEEWVLAKLPASSKEWDAAVERAADAAKAWLARGLERAMDEYNRRAS